LKGKKVSPYRRTKGREPEKKSDLLPIGLSEKRLFSQQNPLQNMTTHNEIGGIRNSQALKKAIERHVGGEGVATSSSEGTLQETE